MVMLIKRDENIEPFDPLAVIEELPPRWSGPARAARRRRGRPPVLARCALVRIYAQFHGL
jgi:hypothetical protein